MSIHDRVSAIFQGIRPDRIPFVDRLEVWYRVHSRAGTHSAALSPGVENLHFRTCHRRQ